ncbi:methyltransferase domain-containing protein [Calothrix sp. NIES-2100]|uniref:methyltransferase domain-containing protein n=1 Tax=Calothrix sp. NIES-2100 TaxID=1954172 RepID=UPI000BBCD97C
MKNLSPKPDYYARDATQRKNWYTKVADAYNQARPRYPQDIICRTLELAHLPSNGIILEIGCGTGIATVAFAQLGFSIVCLEPNQEMCRLAKQNCSQYSSLQFHNTFFEEWELETSKFDAVLAATAFHWIKPDIGYQKAADALKDAGHLILLWNMTPQPPYEIYQALHEIYQQHAPSLAQYEDRATQAEIVRGFGQNIIDSGLFKNLICEHRGCEVTLNTKDYLTLLSTYSPYLALEPQTRDALFTDISELINKKFGGKIQISYLSAFQLAQKI